MIQRARSYFLLGEQYFTTAKLLLETLICNGNSNVGIGCTQEEANEEMLRNASKSDSFLFIPALFQCLQCTELFAKGLLLLSGIEPDDTHNLQKLLEKMAEKYDQHSEIYKTFWEIHYSQAEILKNYRQQNEIYDSKELYISLRYPENTKGKQYRYYELMYNGDRGIDLFQSLCDTMEKLKQLVLNEYTR